jgi:scaffold protein (connect acetoacetyl-CoA thiolase and HMG-CoA synthase)
MDEGITGYKCVNCTWSDFFATKACPRCLSDIKEVSFSGQGKVATFTVVRYPPTGFEKGAPYIVALIDLDVGPRVIGRINAGPNELQVAQTVHYTGTVEGALQFKS